MAVWDINLQSSSGGNRTLICLQTHTSYIVPPFTWISCHFRFILVFFRSIHCYYFTSTSSFDIYSVYIFVFRWGKDADPLKPLSPAWPLIFYLYPSIGLARPQLSTTTHTHTDSSILRPHNSYQAFHSCVNCHIVISRIVMFLSRFLALDVTLCRTVHI